jgi:hypothetical protein
VPGTLGAGSLGPLGHAADDLPDGHDEEQLPGHRLGHRECLPGVGRGHQVAVPTVVIVTKLKNRSWLSEPCPAEPKNGTLSNSPAALQAKAKNTPISR